MKLAELRLRSLTNINFVFTAPPNKSLDASGGSASRNKLGAAQGALICAAASTLTLRSVSEPGAVATGSKIQLCRDHAPVFLSPAKAGFENQRGFDPRATLAALAHPGLLSVAAPRLIDADIRIDSCLSWRYHFRRNPTNRDVSGGSVFRNKLGAAQGALIRPVEIVKLISRGQLNRWVARCVRTGSGSDRIIGSTLSHSVSVSVGRSRAWIFRRRDPRVTLAALAHPGYYLPPLRGSLTMNPKLSVRSDRSVSFYGATQQLAGPGARGACFLTVTRSHPPPHAGCPRGDPGPLPVLTSL